MLGPSNEPAVEALFVTVDGGRVKCEQFPKQENVTDFFYALLMLIML